MITIVFLLVPGVHLLDLAGPAQAFGTAAGLGRGYALGTSPSAKTSPPPRVSPCVPDGSGPSWRRTT